MNRYLKPTEEKYFTAGLPTDPGFYLVRPVAGPDFPLIIFEIEDRGTHASWITSADAMGVNASRYVGCGFCRMFPIDYVAEIEKTLGSEVGDRVRAMLNNATPEERERLRQYAVELIVKARDSIEKDTPAPFVPRKAFDELDSMHAKLVEQHERLEARHTDLQNRVGRLVTELRDCRAQRSELQAKLQDRTARFHELNGSIHSYCEAKAKLVHAARPLEGSND